MARAAVGFREHSGWAALVALGGDLRAPEVLLRERVELLDDPTLPGQVYHAAAGLARQEAAELVTAAGRSARAAARATLGAAAARLAAAGHQVVGVAVGLGRVRAPDDLAAILGNHSHLHTAEGELYREALADAADGLGLPLGRYDFKSLAATAAPILGGDAADRVAAMRGQVGPPWARDQKDAALAAWLALANG